MIDTNNRLLESQQCHSSSRFTLEWGWPKPLWSNKPSSVYRLANKSMNLYEIFPAIVATAQNKCSSRKCNKMANCVIFYCCIVMIVVLECLLLFAIEWRMTGIDTLVSVQIGWLGNDDSISPLNNSRGYSTICLNSFGCHLTWLHSF